MNTSDIAARNKQVAFSAADIAEFKRVYGADIAEAKKRIKYCEEQIDVQRQIAKQAEADYQPRPASVADLIHNYRVAIEVEQTEIAQIEAFLVTLEDSTPRQPFEVPGNTARVSSANPF